MMTCEVFTCETRLPDLRSSFGACRPRIHAILHIRIPPLSKSCARTWGLTDFLSFVSRSTSVMRICVCMTQDVCPQLVAETDGKYCCTEEQVDTLATQVSTVHHQPCISRI